MWVRVASACLMVLVLATVLVAAAQAGPRSLPDNLTVPAQNARYLRAFAAGVQVYACEARTEDPNTFEWTFKAPIAELWNDTGEKIGTHYAGPTWEANDGSTVVGMVVERANAPEPEAIPWLLLQATSSTDSGILTPVIYVQRLETVGGLAPMDGCDRSTVGAERDVTYMATYLFYVARTDVALDRTDRVEAMGGVPSRQTVLAASELAAPVEAR